MGHTGPVTGSLYLFFFTKMIQNETCVLLDVAISGDRNVIKKEAEKILKYKDLNNRNSSHVECDSKSDTGNNRGDWNHFRITQTTPEQHTWEAGN